MAQSPIDASAIPVPTLDAATLQFEAYELRTDAGTIRSRGADIKSTWAGLASVYKAPEDATLLAVMDPVATSTDAFATDTEQVATILSTFASEAGPLVATLSATKASAGTFEAKAKADDKWDHNGDMVKQNNDYVHTVNTTIVAFQAAERKAANAIENLIGGHTFHAADPNSKTQDKYAYGYSSIPDNAKTPWGADVTKKDGCLKSSLTHVGHFFVGVGEGLWGMVKGVGTLAWDAVGGGGWDKFTQAWQGIGFMATLIVPGGTAAGMAIWGPKGYTQRLEAMGKGLVDWNEWKTDPAKAAGNTLVNVGTLFIPGADAAGATADAAKGAELAADAGRAADVAGDAGKAGKLTSTLSKAGQLTKTGLQTFGKYTDPFHYVTQLPKVLDVAKGLGIKIPDLGTLVGHNSAAVSHLSSDAGHVSSDAGHVSSDAGHVSGATHDTGTGARDSSTSHDTGTSNHDTAGSQSGHHHDTNGAGRTHEGNRDGTYRDSAGRLQHEHGGFATDPKSHAHIDVHAVKGESHVVTEHSASFDAQVAEHASSQAQHTADLATRNHLVSSLHDHGLSVEPHELTRSNLDGTIGRLRDSTHDPAVLHQIDQLDRVARNEARSMLHLKNSSEQLGMTAGRDVVTAGGGHVVVGEGTAPGRAGELDIIGVSHDGHTLTVVEAKGGNSHLGDRLVGDERAQQGSTPYLNDLLHRDPRFADYLHKNPEFAARLAHGDVHVEYKLVEAKASGAVKVTDFHLNGDDLKLHDLSPSSGTVDHVSAGHDGSMLAPHHTSDTPPPATRVRLADGTTHQVAYSDAHLHQVSSSSPALSEALSRHGITPQELGELIRTPHSELTPHQAHIVDDVRRSVPEIRTGDPMQKALNGSTGDALLHHEASYPEDSVRGFVSRAGDAAGLHGVAEQRDAFALTYLDHGSPAFPADAPYSYSMRFTTDSVHAPYVPRSHDWGGNFDADAPYTGNGFTASEHRIMPEYRYDHAVTAQPGAEMWRLKADGTEELAGVLDKRGVWVPVE